MSFFYSTRSPVGLWNLSFDVATVFRQASNLGFLISIWILNPIVTFHLEAHRINDIDVALWVVEAWALRWPLWLHRMMHKGDTGWKILKVGCGEIQTKLLRNKFHQLSFIRVASIASAKRAKMDGDHLDRIKSGASHQNRKKTHKKS